MSHHLVHDVAVALATADLEIVQPCLTTDEQRKRAHDLFYQAAVGALTRFEELNNRERRRLNPVPSAN